MPRANTPEHFKYYEVFCQQAAHTQQMAEHMLYLEISLHCKWVKGNMEAVDSAVYWDNMYNHYIAECKLKFTDNRHNYDDGEKSQTIENNNIEIGEEENGN